MVRLILTALLYIVNVNHVPVATFDSFRGMTKWVHDYRLTHPTDPNLSEGRVDIYKCSSYDMIGEKCFAYRHIGPPLLEASSD
jgi:hypothetical protein